MIIKIPTGESISISNEPEFSSYNIINGDANIKITNNYIFITPYTDQIEIKLYNKEYENIIIINTIKNYYIIDYNNFQSDQSFTVNTLYTFYDESLVRLTGSNVTLKSDTPFIVKFKSPNTVFVGFGSGYEIRPSPFLTTLYLSENETLTWDGSIDILLYNVKKYPATPTNIYDYWVQDNKSIWIKIPTLTTDNDSVIVIKKDNVNGTLPTTQIFDYFYSGDILSNTDQYSSITFNPGKIFCKLNITTSFNGYVGLVSSSDYMNISPLTSPGVITYFNTDNTYKIICKDDTTIDHISDTYIYNNKLDIIIDNINNQIIKVNINNQIIYNQNLQLNSDLYCYINSLNGNYTCDYLFCCNDIGENIIDYIRFINDDIMIIKLKPNLSLNNQLIKLPSFIDMDNVNLLVYD